MISQSITDLMKGITNYHRICLGVCFLSIFNLLAVSLFIEHGYENLNFMALFLGLIGTIFFVRWFVSIASIYSVFSNFYTKFKLYLKDQSKTTISQCNFSDDDLQYFLFIHSNFFITICSAITIICSVFTFGLTNQIILLVGSAFVGGVGIIALALIISPVAKNRWIFNLKDEYIIDKEKLDKLNDL